MRGRAFSFAVERARGNVEIETSPGQGTEFALPAESPGFAILVFARRGLAWVPAFPATPVAAESAPSRVDPGSL